MNCKKCGAPIDETKDKFCTQCGEKIIKENNNNQVDMQKHHEAEQKSQPYLIIGIILAFCCSLPFGVAIVLLNEMKYKPQLREGKIQEADKTKNIMVILMIVGFIFGILINGLSIFLEVLSSLE